MKILIIYLAAFFVYNHASANCSKIEGTWSTQQVVDGVTIDITISIKEKSTTSTAVCSRNNVISKAQATAKSSYTDHTLTIEESKQNETSNGDVSCKVSLAAETMGYSMMGNFLLLTQSSGAQFVLMRN